MLNLSSCIIGHAVDLMEGVEARQVEALEDLSAGNIAATDFALRLFLAADQGRNTLLSPVSILSALAMTANGASGETLSEMERTLGMNREMLNEYIFSYVKSLPQGEKYKLKIANSIWIKEDDRFTVNPEFLQANADYFGAGVLKSPFDYKTVMQMNQWVREKTDGMINRAVDQIPGDAIMYLVNALAFDAQWPEYFKSDAVHDGGSDRTGLRIGLAAEDGLFGIDQGKDPLEMLVRDDLAVGGIVERVGVLGLELFDKETQ
jgi:serpin B